MQGGAKPDIRSLRSGDALVEQGEPGTDVYLILDGIFVVEVDGEPVAEIGPGAVVGERAALEGGKRTATLRATTPAKVAGISAGELDPGDLGMLAATRHREDRPEA
jgi:CRP-like cAMP-binding protein